MSLYDILGVSPTASADEIKKVYRQQAMKWHPDRNPHNREEADLRFKEIAHAYSVLSDPIKRRDYDETALGAKDAFQEASDDFTADKAFATFLAAMLDLAFEMALRGGDQITIYRALVAGGCPESIAQTVASRAHKMANRPSANPADGSPAGRSRKSSSDSTPPRPRNRPAGKDKQPEKSGPWARFLARAIDLAVVAVLALTAGIAMAVTLPSWKMGAIPSALLSTLVFGIVLLGYEAVALSLFGTTIGKATFGLRITAADGGLLELKGAFRRAFWVWASGNACYFFFPAASMYFWWRGYKALTTTGSTSWDDKVGSAVTQSTIGSFRFLLGASVSVLLLLGGLVLSNLNKHALKQELKAQTNPFDQFEEEKPSPSFTYLDEKPGQASKSDKPINDALARSERMKNGYATADYNAVIREATSGHFLTNELKILGAAYVSTGQAGQAVLVYRQAEKAFPTDTTVKCALAGALYLIGQYESSIAKYREVFALDSANNNCRREDLERAESLYASQKQSALMERKRVEQERAEWRRAEYEREHGCVVKPTMTDADFARCRSR